MTPTHVVSSPGYQELALAKNSDFFVVHVLSRRYLVELALIKSDFSVVHILSRRNLVELALTINSDFFCGTCTIQTLFG